MLSRTRRGKYTGGLVVAALVASVFAWSNRPTVAGDEAIVQDRALLDIEGPEVDKPVPPDALPTPTDEVILQLRPGTDARAVAAANGLAPVYRLQSDNDLWVMRALSAEALDAAAFITTNDARVTGAYPNDRSAEKLTVFTPNDPYFHKNTPAAGWPGQWHLINEHVSGRDAGVKKAWAANLTGLGVRIGIVDDCLETAHQDLAANYIAGDSFDFGQGDANPNPVNAGDQHGISVAGVAAARGNNALGVTGAAPYARLAGLRIDFPLQTTAMFVDATLYHSSGGNTNIKIKNHSYGPSAPFSPRPATTAALQTSLGAGTIHCISAGNNRGGTAQDTNKLDNTNEIGTISVAALGSDGTFADYSNFGACIACTAPSSSFKAAGLFGITTTDRTGAAFGYNGPDLYPDTRYTSLFGGTSSASPLVAGVMALIKEAKPTLNSRMAKHILSKTCTIVDAGDVSYASDGGWVTNAAGRRINQNYGWGNINAGNMRTMALELTGLTGLSTGSGTFGVAEAIPDNSTAGVTKTFSLTGFPNRMEEMSIVLDITHPDRGDIRAYLTSPSGTTSRLVVESAGDGGAFPTWEFVSNAFWGENPNGAWTLNVQDVFVGDLGTWNDYTVNVRTGNYIPTVPNTPGKLIVTGTTTSSISLGWGDRSYVEDGVRVYRKLSTSLFYTLIATKAANSTAHVDLTPVSGLTYNYKVRAFNATGNSLYSNIVTILAP